MAAVLRCRSTLQRLMRGNQGIFLRGSDENSLSPDPACCIISTNFYQIDANPQHHVRTGQSVLWAPAWGKSSWVLPKAAPRPTLSGAESSALGLSIADTSTLVFQATCVPSCMFQRRDYNGQYLHDCTVVWILRMVGCHIHSHTMYSCFICIHTCIQKMCHSSGWSITSG